jgi:homogentisate 1,2-dioxygenase
MTQPDANAVINELTAIVANLVKENAILKATVAAYQQESVATKINEKMLQQE